jgi:hypothetical protein
MQHPGSHLRSSSRRGHRKVAQRAVSTSPPTQGTNVTAEFLNSKRNRLWSKLLSKDLGTEKAFHEVYPSILGKLAQDIIVKESRFTWVVEQKMRFDYTMSSVDSEGSPLTVQDFLNKYNEDIEYGVLFSNLGFAAEIDQAESALEKH